MKVCTKCNKNLPLADFSFLKISKDGLSYNCRNCSSKRYKEYYSESKGLIASRNKSYRENNYERRVEIEKASRLKHKESNRFKRNARQSVRNKIVQEKKFLILNKELNKIYTSPCFACGSTDNQSLDHLIPLARGGNHSVGNIITLCLPCNMSKNKKTLTEWFKFKRMIGVG